MNRLAELILQDAHQIFAKIDYSELVGKRILITGASGLIGTHFLASLNYLKAKANLSLLVYAIVNNDPEEYFKDITGFDGVEIIGGDLTDASFVRNLPKANFIIHAAGYGQPGKFLQDPVKTIKLNTVALLGLFEKVVDNGKLLFISTSEVYTGSLHLPYSEKDIGNTNTDHPRACYIEAKRCGETICNAHRQKGIQAKSARVSLAYGPGTRKGDRRVINEFIQKGLEGGISLIDQGHARRTYCYITDAVEIMWNILLKGSGAIYNVGGLSKVTVRELAQRIGDYLKVPVIFPTDVSGSLTGAPNDVYMDMMKVEHEFKKREYIDLADGLTRTIEWQKLFYNVCNTGE